MSDIYQQIWDADQSGSGVKPILDSETGDPDQGFVKVNSKLDVADRTLRVLPEVVIPERKSRTYTLCRRLFDNYALPERDEEFDSPREREELHDLVHAMVDTAPMQVAREYVARASGASITKERWYNTIMDLWFRRFSMGGDPHLTGFEHIVVGEQEGAKAQGYHFWYKYYLDDGFAHLADGSAAFPGLQNDRIAYLGSQLSRDQAQFPESVTISYVWQAPDYDREKLRPLTKPKGGFFVGCSVEGLLALGTLRAHAGARAPKEAVLNGARYSLRVFTSENRRHIRTFYPVFIGPDDSGGTKPGEGGGPVPPVIADEIRIVAALVNPPGHDPGNETVTLINTGAVARSLDGWRLEDKNGRQQSLSGLSIASGEAARVTLDPAGAQLSNKGGRVSLIDGAGRVAHGVTYSKGQARADGRTILF